MAVDGAGWAGSGTAATSWVGGLSGGAGAKWDGASIGGVTVAGGVGVLVGRTVNGSGLVTANGSNRFCSLQCK